MVKRKQSQIKIVLFPFIYSTIYLKSKYPVQNQTKPNPVQTIFLRSRFSFNRSMIRNASPKDLFKMTGVVFKRGFLFGAAGGLYIQPGAMDHSSVPMGELHFSFVKLLQS